MGRRRTRRTPSWVAPRWALFQPADNPPQPASWNIDPAGHRHPHETALKGLATIARGWYLRCLPRVPPPQKLPPLPRDPLRRTQQASSRGRGRGRGSNKLPSRETPPTFPPSKTQSGRQPGERLASAKWWKRGQRTRGSNAMRVFDHGEAESTKYAVNRAFASGWRPARVHQPADAGRSPNSCQAWPKPARSRTQTTRPRRLSVHRSNRWDAIRLTNCVRRKSSCAGARLLGSRACSDRMGRRRTRRTPSWVTPRGALFQPADNPPQSSSWNIDPAGHRHPHETALKGLATIARGWHLRCLPRVPPPQKLPPLPRDPLRRTQQASSRGRGRGWGSNKLPSRETAPTLPPSKTQFRRQPGERLASAKW